MTEDGFILTTRRAVSPWHSTFEMNLINTPGILMSADLKQVLETNVPAPKNWVPAQTKPRRGKLGKLNITINSTGSYAGQSEDINVSYSQSLDSLEVQKIMVSNKQEIGMLKIITPGKFAKLELSDNSETLQKGAQNLYIVHLDLSDNSPLSKFQNIEVLEKMKSEDFKTAHLWGITPTLVSDFQQIKNLGNVMLLKNNLPASKGEQASAVKLHYTAFSDGYSGSPVFDNQGQIIGIYLAYDRETDSHHVVPIHFARKAMAGN